MKFKVDSKKVFASTGGQPFDANKPLIVFEMANNHMGDMNHGLLMIDTFGKYVKEYPEFDFSFKFQFKKARN